ncbi:uncharacterized protein yc1106_04261 [Curvularia clavata]|uniref:Uncharacterized protein n=1 Tax=Curvularia clavata TaxID=95742 RepID=A0A9Q9DRT6_CURCL|nr:uncharacterized protein yc1106_04261 [Curvularia clavata]
MAQQQEKGHWLDKYATDYADWKLRSTPDGNQSFQRPLGLVETSFDIDGRYFGGRADMNALFTLAVQHKLSKDELRHKIALAWTSLRLQHPLLLARVQEGPDTVSRGFAVDLPSTQDAAIQATKDDIVWVEDAYEEVSDEEMYHHAYNVTRIIVPEKFLSKVHVLPVRRLSDGTFALRFLITIAHQISDALSTYNWFSHFHRILNQPSTEILADIEALRKADKMKAILPRAQEDLYPPVTGNRARQRWFWALIRVLRHVHKGLPPTFTNPLRREQRLKEPLALEPKFSKIFDYSAATRPPMSCGHIPATLSASASARLISLCRSAQVSIGAGCFAFAGLAMMALQETLHPSPEQPAFTASFPLNPRPFFTNPPPADSCMLAFSDGIVMPFLSSDLPIERRFKLIAKHANRGLRVYQKRLKDKGTTGPAAVLDKYSPGRLLATGYIAQIERIQAKLPAELRFSSSYSNPQGALPPMSQEFGATCGVSSTGPLAAFFERGPYNVHELGDGDFVAEFRDVMVGVRARENEFLVGASTSIEGIVRFAASYDLSAISEERAVMWKKMIEGLLETREEPSL